MCVDFVIRLLFVHDCLLHDCSVPCMTSYRLCLLGTCVSPYLRITNLGRPFLMDCLCCLGVIPNFLPSTKLRVWNKV